MLLIDESGFGKKGDRSAGVARQYNGRLGKVDNCQVGVFSALSLGSRAVLTGARLYLPKEWVEDPERSKRAGIPAKALVLKTKSELAWELIQQAEQEQIPFGWVGMDSGYGRDQGLLLKVAGMGKRFVADVDHDQLVWTAEPQGPLRPQSVTGSGAQRVDALWEAGRRSSRKYLIRRGENGPVRVRFLAQRVWIWPPSCEVALEVWLLVSKRADGQLKYSLCNADSDMTMKELACRQGQRYFVERGFEDGKSELGMGQYQARKWLAWHHHMALVGAAMVFALAERDCVGSGSPLTSVRDVVDMVSWYFAEERTDQDLEAMIRERHRRRAISMEIRNRRKRPRGKPAREST